MTVRIVTPLIHAKVGGAIAMMTALLVLLACPAQARRDDRSLWKKSFGPLVPHATFPKDCSLCHVPERWDVLKSDFHFDHEKETGVALQGAHAQAACLRCHNDRGPAKVYAARGCSGCHQDPHTGAMGLSCERCHNQTVWQPQGEVASHARTRFPLTGSHLALQCEQCHPQARAGRYRGIPVTCDGCHAPQYQAAANHVAMNFPKACQSCHTTMSFSGARFNHATLGANPNCYGCHASDYPRGPNHVSQHYPTACANCHNTTSWSSAGFDHSTLGANPNCYSCHASNYNGAANHVSRAYPTTCNSCHTTTAWVPATFNHSALGSNPTCYTCHAADYTQGPNHVSLGYPTTCASCHNTTSWSNATFTHTFPLTGNHNVSCASCHTGSNTSSFSCTTACHAKPSTDSHHGGVPGYSYSSPACYSCHPNGRAN